MGSQDILTSIEGNLLGLDVNHNLMVLGLSFMSSPGVGLGSKVVMAAQASKHTYTIPDKGADATFQLLTSTPGANGLVASKLALLDFTNSDGTNLAAAASAGKFGMTFTLGTVFKLIGETANTNTKTDDALIEYVLPASYVAGSAFSVTVNASITGAGTFGTKTITVLAYKTANDGTQGANIGPAAVAITAAGADTVHVITPTGLVAGDKLILDLRAILQETGGVNSNVNINSVRFS